MIQEAIFARLSTFAGLTALIGVPPACRLYPRLLPQDSAYPAVTYFKVDETRLVAMGVNPGLAHARFQFDCWDKDRTKVRDVTEQLRQALERWTTTFLVGGVTKRVQDSFVENVQEPQPELVDAETVFRTITDVMVHYTE